MTGVTRARDEAIATGSDCVAVVARQLCTVRGVAQTNRSDDACSTAPICRPLRNVRVPNSSAPNTVACRQDLVTKGACPPSIRRDRFLIDVTNSGITSAPGRSHFAA
jgi:hypothetical protein